MQYVMNDITPKRVLYVDFEPVRKGEFGGKHLAVIIKANADRRSAIVVPLTGHPSGDNKIKINLPKSMTGFPANLTTKDTYAVLNEVRTVFYRGIDGHGRMSDIMSDNHKPLIVEIDVTDYNRIIDGCIEHLVEKTDENQKMSMYVTKLTSIITKKIVNLAYCIIKANNQADIIMHEQAIKELVHFEIEFESLVSEKDKQIGILDVIHNALRSNVNIVRDLDNTYVNKTQDNINDIND